MTKGIIISNSNELLRLLPHDIVYIAAERNYSDIHLTDGEKRTVVMQLGQMETLIAHQLREKAQVFVRIGRRLIINMEYIFFIHPQRQKLVLKDGSGRKYELGASHDALDKLKRALEQIYYLPNLPERRLES